MLEESYLFHAGQCLQIILDKTHAGEILAAALCDYTTRASCRKIGEPCAANTKSVIASKTGASIHASGGTVAIGVRQSMFQAATDFTSLSEMKSSRLAWVVLPM